jgi:DNA-binding Xre family transcriptional regulator
MIKNLISNDVAWSIDEINKLYRNGKIKGITFQLLLEDGEFVTCHSGDITFLEKLGMIESAKNNIFLSVED